MREQTKNEDLNIKIKAQLIEKIILKSKEHQKTFIQYIGKYIVSGLDKNNRILNLTYSQDNTDASQ